MAMRAEDLDVSLDLPKRSEFCSTGEWEGNVPVLTDGVRGWGRPEGDWGGLEVWEERGRRRGGVGKGRERGRVARGRKEGGGGLLPLLTVIMLVLRVFNR